MIHPAPLSPDGQPLPPLLTVACDQDRGESPFGWSAPPPTTASGWGAPLPEPAGYSLSGRALAWARAKVETRSPR